MVKKILISVVVIMIPIASWFHWPSWVMYAFAIIALVLIFLPTNTNK
ncbi:hypothetical protein [Corynebacterium sp. p3-SID1194]|nr:hypothetical protein [Corynebacterium sp. p3-SID1194]MCT1449086.1 hypothetical protein [Corynebacterium sp. p3-SID1194]